jgi:hypothetical protein
MRLRQLRGRAILLSIARPTPSRRRRPLAIWGCARDVALGEQFGSARRSITAHSDRHSYPQRLMKHSIRLPLTPSTATVQAAIFLLAFAILASIAFGIVR